MKLLIAILILASLSGCVYTSFEAPGPNGVKLKRIGIGTGTNIAELQIPMQGGVAKMKGYSSEQAEVAAAMIDAAFRAGAASAGLSAAQAQSRQVNGDTPARAPDR